MRNSFSPRSAFRLTLSLLTLPMLPALAVDATTVFNEVMYHPADDAGAEWIELHNQMSVNMDLAGWRISGGVNYTFPEGVTIPAGGYLLVSSHPAALQAAAGVSGVLGPWTGQLSNSSETITLRNRIDRVMDEFSYSDSGDFPVGADGGGVTLAKRRKNSASGEAANWALSGVVGGTPAGENFPAAGLPGPLVTLSDYGAAWKYLETGADLGANWAQTTYAAGAGGWKEGPGVLAFTADTPALPVGTVLAPPGGGVVTHYFQRSFSFTGDPARTVLQLGTLLDDGAVVYLNGTEVARTGMPDGAVSAGTAASVFVDQAAVAGPLTLPSAALVAGTNVLSVEVHQYPDIPPAPEAPDAGGTVQTGGGLTLAQLGGSLSAGQNLALAANGGSSFAKDVLTGYPAHSIPHLNDGLYGNSNSWIGNSLNSFCGIRLGAGPVTVGGIAWGRDQTGVSSDRSAGTYTVQFTTAANPGATTPESAWTTIGTVTYTAAAAGFPIQQRHRFNFPPVQATGVRLICPGNGVGTGTCVDELELYAAAWNGSDAFSADPAAGFHLARTGGDGPAGAVPDNFARASNGAVAFGSGELRELANGAYRYNIADVNDGFYGNNNSWISAGGADPFIGVRFAGTVPLGRVAWGRDNAGNLTDRSLGTYTLQYTSVAAPGAATAETGDAATGWRTIGAVRIAGSDSAFSQSKRHEFAVSGSDGAPLQATRLRIKVSDPGICIDELEASAPPPRDVVFGAQLLSRETLPPAGDPTLVINEIGGSGDAVWRLELRNQGTAPLSLGGVVVAASGVPGGGHTLPAQTLAPGGLLVLEETQLGFRPVLDGRVFLYAAGRGQLLDAAMVGATPRARMGDEFLTPSAATFGAENTFSLNRDVVINEIMYNSPLLPGSPPVTNPEEWLELYNKGTAPVDLGGWSLDDGITWTIPAGTVLEAGGYLVIAKDAAALKAKWPEQAARIVGNFSGSLANSGERVSLRDAAGNPASVVHYLTGGAWPEMPDGGGASLELRDPRADLSNGASWAAGRPLAGSNWQTVTYTMPSDQKFGQTQWNEFRFGMLDAGECLIDDVSVVRVSSGQQLIQGGDFESLATKWRMLGNHGASAVVEEPGNPGNHVLHVRSTGSFAFNHNHIETTFKGASLNTPLAQGQSYTVTFRAKWLGGCNLLNSRAYYSRLPATTALTIPSRLGSPGRVNSTAVANIGPALAGLSHSPVIPAANAPVTVTVRAQDPDGLGAVNLQYALNGAAAFTAVPMTAAGGGVYTGVIPGQAARTLVQFYVEAADGTGVVSHLPAEGPASRALYVVNDGAGTALSAHEFRVLMLPADRTSLLATVNRLSDGRIGGTVVYQRNEVFYDIGVRLQGTAAGRIRDGDLYTGFDVGFNRDQLFRGVHDSVNIDRSGRSPAAGGRDEIYVKHMFHRAGLPCTYDDLIYFVAPTTTYTGTAILQMAGYEKTFVDSQFDGAEGTVFNLEVTYEPSTTSVAGNVESLKNPVPLATQLSADFTDFGNDKEQYRGQLEPRAGRKYDDFTDLIAFCKAMSQTSAANLSAQVAARMDVDEWMRCAALYSLCGLEDCYLTGGFQHNLRMWVPRGGGGGVKVLPWDMDFVFYKPATSPALLAGGNLLRFINANGAAKRAYYGHLQDLCNTVFNSAYMTPWLTHYGRVVGQSMAGQASYINSRRNYVMAASRLPASVPFAITTNGGADFTVDTPSVTLAGTGWINVRTFRRADTGEVLEPMWTTDKAWQLTIPLKSGANPLTIQAFDFQGVRIAEKAITVTSTGALPLPVDFLRITELMYHPSDPVPSELAVSADAEDFEFIELRNTGSLPLDISGCRFTAGVDFTFPASTVLAAGEHILVVRNQAAFQARHGAAARVAGTYGPANALSNSGETLTLTDATGRVIQSFAYSDTDPWPKSADGQGRSLVLIAPQSASAADWSLASGWRASMTPGGNPNGSDAAVFTGTATADTDGDGLNALLEFALGTSDSVPDTASVTRLTPDAGGLLFTFPRAANADGLVYTIETSPDFIQWTPAAGAVLMSSLPAGNGLMQTWRLPPQEGARLFVRLKAAAR